MTVLHDTLYLDYAACVPLHPDVREAMLPWLDCANPSSNHAPGRAAEAAVEQARSTIAAWVGAQPEEIIWTSGATESNNLAILGALAGREPGHIVSSRIEHKAVLDPIKQLASQGWRVTWLEPDAEGLIHADAVAGALQPDTALVSLMWVNNELGTLTDIGAVGALCRANNTLLHVDAAQALAWLDVDVHAAQVDLLSIAGQKIAGPKGSGALFVRGRPPLRLQPRSFGGGHERGLRPGTLAVHQIVGLAAAGRRITETRANESARVAALRDRAWAQLQAAIPSVFRNGASDQVTPHVLNFSVPDVNGELLVFGLSDLALSTGSACSSASRSPSYVLRALGRDDALAEASLRLSFGWGSTEQHVDTAVARIAAVVERLRSLHPNHDGALCGDASTLIAPDASELSRRVVQCTRAACAVDAADARGLATTPASDAQVAIDLRQSGAAWTARFRAVGNPATLAVADLVCEAVDAHGVDAALAQAPADILASLGLDRLDTPAVLQVHDALRAAWARATRLPRSA